MNQNELLIDKFYSAFQRKDFKTMNECYHADATFSDPVFRNLSSKEVKAMWEMLLTGSTDLRIVYAHIVSEQDKGRAHWEAWYTFTKTGRKVHNMIDATFVFKDGLFLSHRDRFDLWRWTRMALGPIGVLAGWTPLIERKVRKMARGRLENFMRKKA